MVQTVLIKTKLWFPYWYTDRVLGYRIPIIDMAGVTLLYLYTENSYAHKTELMKRPSVVNGSILLMTPGYLMFMFCIVSWMCDEYSGELYDKDHVHWIVLTGQSTFRAKDYHVLKT